MHDCNGSFVGYALLTVMSNRRMIVLNRRCFGISACYLSSGPEKLSKVNRDGERDMSYVSSQCDYDNIPQMFHWARNGPGHLLLIMLLSIHFPTDWHTSVNIIRLISHQILIWVTKYAYNTFQIFSIQRCITLVQYQNLMRQLLFQFHHVLLVLSLSILYSAWLTLMCNQCLGICVCILFLLNPSAVGA